MKIKKSVIFLSIFLYLIGRICLTASLNSKYEYKRFVNLINLPQFIYTPAKIAIQREKVSDAIIRKKYFQKTYLNPVNKEKYFLCAKQFITLNSYSGNYIDPPRLL